MTRPGPDATRPRAPAVTPGTIASVPNAVVPSYPDRVPSRGSRSVFISYSHADKQLARSLAGALERKGLGVWIDEGELQIGDSIIERIAQAIAEVEIFLVLVSESSRTSNWKAALSACRTFVPLYSRRYFENNICGSEWFAFACRELNQRAQGGRDGHAIVPALWTRLDRDSIPEIAQRIQYEHAGLPARYRTEGLYGLMQLREYRSDYRRAVHQLAEWIVEVGRDKGSPADLPVGLEDSVTAFGPASMRRTTGQPLTIAVVAYQSDTLPPGRSGDCYGEKPTAWTPYWPDYPMPLADYVADLSLTCLGIRPRIASLDDLLEEPGRLQWTPTIVLVDPWVTTDLAYRQQLKRLDEIAEPWVSVLIPWNHYDTGISDSGLDLRDTLNQLLGRRLASVPRRCLSAAEGIPTLPECGRMFALMAVILAKRFEKSAPSF